MSFKELQVPAEFFFVHKFFGISATPFA